MAKITTFLGKKFGRLTIIRIVGRRGHNTVVKFLCSCGKTKEALFSNIKKGDTRSCGCIFTENLTKRNTSHGRSATRIYRIYKKIKSRTENSNILQWNDYGGRGIKNSWKTFEQFYKDMNSSYEQHIKEHGERQTTIDRIDNNSHYSKRNCRWATYKQQRHNRRDSVIV